MSSAVRSLAALVAGVALLAGCASTGASAPASPAEASVQMQGFAFAPKTLSIAKGTKVTWTNKDATTHTVTGGTPPSKDGKFDLNVPAGATATFTFNDAGTFAYFCTIHNSMTATIEVK